jgi:thiamine biosynthesis lipoprotein
MMKFFSIFSNSWQRQLFVFSVVAFSVLAAGCQQQKELKLTGPIMGTQFNITLACLADKKVDQLNEAQWQAAVVDVMESVNQSMSTWIKDSEISKFNQSTSTEFVPISGPMLDVLSGAQRVSTETQGAFDVTVMPLVNLWGFGWKDKGVKIAPPTVEQLESIRDAIGYEKIELDDSLTKWRKTIPNLEVDFSAIAKGYAVDKVSDKLLELGCENHLVEIGGELQAQGKNAEDKVWRLAVEKPDTNGAIQVLINADNVGIASSGDYNNFYIVDGKRFSHTIDPRTLRPIEHNLASVTVANERTQRADALATAFMVMGEEAVRFAEENDIAAYFIFRELQESDDSAGQFNVLYTKAFEKYLLNP